jgi:Flp pilus assembly pilin Flp
VLPKFEGKPVLRFRAMRQSARRGDVGTLLRKLWSDEDGQDIAEYAVMLAVILVIVVGTVRLIGSNANNVFSSVGSAIGN